MNNRAGLLLICFLACSAVFLTRLPAQGQQPAAESSQGLILKPEVSYNAENLRDPFQSAIKLELLNSVPETAQPVPDLPMPELKVQGIFWGGIFPQAIINDKVLKAGDTVDGVRIISIEKDNITAFFNAKQFKLSANSSTQLNGHSKQEKKEDTNED
jgi:hypothetical protein